MATPSVYNPAAVGNLATSANLIFDPNQVSIDGFTTGMWRAYKTTDLANLTISGMEVVVGNIGVTGLVTTIPANATTTNNYSQSGSAGQTLLTGQILAANPARVQTYIQVIGSGGPLYVKLGAAPASQQSFSILLKPASSDFGQDGGIWSDNGFWKGIVSVSGTTRVIAWEA